MAYDISCMLAAERRQHAMGGMPDTAISKIATGKKCALNCFIIRFLVTSRRMTLQDALELYASKSTQNLMITCNTEPYVLHPHG